MTDLGDRLRARSIQDNDTGCWLWQGGTNKPGGYGTLSVHSRKQYVHRLAYELYTGVVPEGQEVDHLCRTRTCWNPAHLEAVTVQENRARSKTAKTHCKHGHLYDEANTRWQTSPKGYRTRYCLACNRVKKRGGQSR